MEKIVINNYILDEEQSCIAMSEDKYSLVVAGAGAGKTLTIIGKIYYLIAKKNYLPQDFCCISFTNEAASNLKNKIKETCHCEISTFTFHKLALSILSKQNIHYSICSDNLLDYIIDEFLASRCFGHKKLQRIIYSYFGYIFPTRSNWDKVMHSKKLFSFKKLAHTFISLVKNHYDFDLRNVVIQNQKKYPILLIFYAIYLIYIDEKKAYDTFDFDDMIIKAIELLKSSFCSLPYKFIIIDEFQDTSDIRFLFVQELLKQTGASLCVVGDDCQSIYHFSGCDLNFFLNFKRYYPNAKVYKIQNTYRNSQELIDIAGNFVQKNPYQISKTLKSSIHINLPIKIVYFRNKKNVFVHLLKQINPSKSIFVLGRNHFNLNYYFSNYELGPHSELLLKGFEQYHMRYLTIHSSKGLESDIVILLDVEASEYGIPSLVRDEDVLSLVKSTEYFPFEEERRLFYVALTRAKEYVYLLVPYRNPSCFLKEIKKDRNVDSIMIF